MATSPDALVVKFARCADDLSFKIPVKGLARSGAIVLAAAKAGADRAKPPGGGSLALAIGRVRGQPAAFVYGWGWAVLAEYGSYRHPDGWEIKPRKYGARQARSKNKNTRALDRKALAAARRLGYAKVMLGDKSTGFAAAYVNRHPPIAASPYQEKATAATAKPVAAAYDREVVKSLAAIF